MATLDARWLCLGAVLCWGCSQDPTAPPAGTAGKRAPQNREKAPPATEPEATERPQARLLFGGDVTITDGIGRQLDRRARGQSIPAHVDASYPWDAPTLARIRGADWTLFNLECVASPLGHSLKPVGLRCASSLPGVLHSAGVDAVSVANNHALDFGERPFEDAVSRLRQRGPHPIGAESIRHQPPKPSLFDINGLKLAALAFYRPPSDLAEVERAAAQADVSVVMMHWGKEGQAAPMPQQRELGEALLKAGITIVVGAHAHVVQPLERRGGQLLAFGLGNLVFDAMPLDERTRRGLLLEVEVSAAGVEEVTAIDTEMGDHLRVMSDPG